MSLKDKNQIIQRIRKAYGATRNVMTTTSPARKDFCSCDLVLGRCPPADDCKTTEIQIFRGKRGASPVAVIEENGGGDCRWSDEFYYGADGKPFFVFRAMSCAKADPAADSFEQLRWYFDKGNLIECLWKSVKDPKLLDSAENRSCSTDDAEVSGYLLKESRKLYDFASIVEGDGIKRRADRSQ